ncbi:MAG: chalcone isomerase family protein [Pseudomonadota bacterium]|nr:chalcone isomerase family protein [Pseudomonadota bacterium]
MTNKLAGAIIALILSSVLHAAEVGGVKLEDRISLGGQELVLNGAGVRTRAIFKVYVASLYVPQKTADAAVVQAKGPRRIQLNLLRTLSADQLADALNDGLAEANSPAEFAAVKPQAEELVGIMKAFKEVKEKDIVTLDFVDGSTKVGWNGESKGAIAGELFNRALTRIWIGDKPVQADLKKALLGG